MLARVIIIIFLIPQVVKIPDYYLLRHKGSTVKYKHTERIGLNIMHDKDLQNKTTCMHSMMP